MLSGHPHALVARGQCSKAPRRGQRDAGTCSVQPDTTPVRSPHTSCTGERTPPASAHCREGTTKHGRHLSGDAMSRLRMPPLGSSDCAGHTLVSSKSNRQADAGSYDLPGSPSLTAGLPCVSGRTGVVSDRRYTLPHGRRALYRSAWARPDVFSNGHEYKPCAYGGADVTPPGEPTRAVA